MCCPDAYSGDAIPIHLLTKEAVQLYLRHLKKPNGILAFHISNKALDLRPVIAKLASESNMCAWLADSDPWTPGNASGTWVIATPLQRVGLLPGAEHMTRLSPSSQFRLWTDDYSNVMSVLRW